MSEGIIKAEPACSRRQDNSHGLVGRSERSVARELGVVVVKTGQVSGSGAVLVVEVRSQGFREARRRSTYVEMSCQMGAWPRPLPSPSSWTPYCLSQRQGRSQEWPRPRSPASTKTNGPRTTKRLCAFTVAQDGQVDVVPWKETSGGGWWSDGLPRGG